MDRLVNVLVTITLAEMMLAIGLNATFGRPPLAAGLQRPANLASMFLNVGVIGLILAVQSKLLMEIRPLGLIGMIGLVIISWLAGWTLSGPPPDARKAMAVTSSLRNVSVGLVIATSAFAGTAAVTAVVAFGLVSLFGTLGLAILSYEVMPTARYRRGAGAA